MITWSSGDRLLTAGPVKVYNEERLIHKHNGSQITLRYSYRQIILRYSYSKIILNYSKSRGISGITTADQSQV